MSIKNQDSLFNLSFDLSEYGYKMHVSESGEWYRVYTGPFTDNSQADKALAVIKENISKEAFVTYLDFDSNGVRISKDKKVIKPKAKTIKPKVPKTVESKKSSEVTKVKVVQNDDSSLSIETYKKKVDKKVEKKIIPKDKTIIINKIVKTKKLTEEQKKQQAAKLRNKVKNRVNLYRDTRFFVGMSAGISNFAVSQEDVGTPISLDYHPKDGGITYGLEAGYYFNNNIFATANYQHTTLDNLYFDNIFASLNYQFTNMELASPYIGILGGYNIMTWSSFPITSAVIQGNSSSFFTGLQIGNDMPLNERISAYIFYRYMILENVTNISEGANTKVISHGNEQNINVGIKYNF